MAARSPRCEPRDLMRCRLRKPAARESPMSHNSSGPKVREDRSSRSMSHTSLGFTLHGCGKAATMRESSCPCKDQSETWFAAWCTWAVRSIPRPCAIAWNSSAIGSGNSRRPIGVAHRKRSVVGFVNGERGISLDTAAKLCQYLDLELLPRR